MDLKINNKIRQTGKDAQIEDKLVNTLYLYSLAVVDFHYVEVKTVNPFARRDEVTSLLVEILPNVH